MLCAYPPELEGDEDDLVAVVLSDEAMSLLRLHCCRVVETAGHLGTVREGLYARLVASQLSQQATALRVFVANLLD